MCCSECIVNKDVTVRSKFLCHYIAFCSILRCFFLVESCIFQHCNSTFWKSVDCCLLSECIREECNFLSEFFREIFYNWSHAVLAVDELFCICICPFLSSLSGLFCCLLYILFWIAKVAHENEGTWALFKNVLDCRESCHNTCVILYNSVLHWNIEVNSHDDALSLKINIFYCLNHIKKSSKWNLYKKYRLNIMVF